MGKKEIYIPDELEGVWEVMKENLSSLQRTLSRLDGGKAVDYAEVGREVSEEAGKSERATHLAILQSLDIDVPAVVIGGERYTRVGRCEDQYHTLAGSISVERSLYRRSGAGGGSRGGQGGRRGEPTCGCGGRWLASAYRTGDGARSAEGNVTGSRSDWERVRATTLLTFEL